MHRLWILSTSPGGENKTSKIYNAKISWCATFLIYGSSWVMQGKKESKKEEEKGRGTKPKSSLSIFCLWDKNEVQKSNECMYTCTFKKCFVPKVGIQSSCRLSILQISKHNLLLLEVLQYTLYQDWVIIEQTYYKNHQKKKNHKNSSHFCYFPVSYLGSVVWPHWALANLVIAQKLQVSHYTYANIHAQTCTL